MRTNTVKKVPAKLTHEGARAVNINAVDQLRRSVMSCMLWEGTFYESGVDIAKRIHEEVEAVLKLKSGADMVANIAYEARTKFKLRHAPLWLVLALVRDQSPQSRAVVSGAIASVIQRPDEIPEFLAMMWKDKKTPIPNQVKKGLAEAFRKFDRYSLSKYANREGGVKLRDVLFMIHAKPKDEEQAQLWKELAEGNLKMPEETWERVLSENKTSKKEAWEKVIDFWINVTSVRNHMAIIRNLRNIMDAGVSEHHMEKLRACFKHESWDKTRVLPFRFITAAKYAPTLEPQLEEAMFRCLENSPKLGGRTVFVVDCSGSMHGNVSEKSELLRLDAAASLAMLLREVCEDVVVYATAGDDGSRKHATMLIPARRGFGLRDLLKYENTVPKIGGGGIFLKQVIDVLREKEPKSDRIIVFTDEQDCDLVNKPASAKPFGKHNYLINVGTDKNGIGYGDWTHIDGWSEATLEFIHQAEQQV